MAGRSKTPARLTVQAGPVADVSAESGADEDDEIPVLATSGPAAEPARRAIVDATWAGKRLDAALAGLFADVSRTQFARHIGDGAVLVGGKGAAPAQKLRLGDVIDFAPPPPKSVDILPENIPIDVVFEDEHLLVVNKPAGLVVHPAVGHESGTLVNAVLWRCRDLRGIGGEIRPGIVHRLDKDTSGLMVVAKDEPTLVGLSALFKVHDVQRKYDVLAVGAPSAIAGRMDTLHGRDPNDRKKFSIKVKSGKRAVTNWRLVESLVGGGRFEAQLETGRTHQVRVHFASMNCPLLGDATYGRSPRDVRLRSIANQLGRQALHARVLGFRHPRTGGELFFEREAPPDFLTALQAWRDLATQSKS